MSALTKARGLGQLIKGDATARWRATQLLAQQWAPGVLMAMGEHSKAWMQSPSFAELAKHSGAPTKQWERLFID